MPLRLDVKRKLLARSDRVKSVDLHPTEPWLLAALYNGNVHIWNYDTQQLVKSFEVCDLPVRAAKFVPRKAWVVTGSDDMHVRVYNYNTLERVHQFEAHSDYLRAIAVHPTQSFILTSSDDMLIKLWDWDNKWALKQTFEGHTHYVMQIAINPKDNNTFATASLDKTVKVWQFGSQSPNFTLEGHEKGVNCVDYYHGGDKPYLISGADDHLVKIWDYQNKTCVQTLDGHTQNVSSVCFHPELPLIITGSEDSTTGDHAQLRPGARMAQKGSNTVALGYDEGSVTIKLGREEPAVSMDASGKVLWAKHSVVQQVNLKTIDAATLDALQDGERIPLAVKELGSSEIYPQALAHSANGRYVVACGDGEYIVYTAMALRNKDFGQALEFAWATDPNVCAVRESSASIKIKKNFKDYKQIRLDMVGEGMDGGPLLSVRSATALCFYDWESAALVRRIEIAAKRVYWSDGGELCVIASEESFYVLRYDGEAFERASAEEITDDGVEDAFEVIGEQSEAVRTGIWIGDCFVFSTANTLKYYVGGEIVPISHTDRPLYLLGYMADNSRVYLVDKELNVCSYKLLLSVLEYQTAVMRKDFDAADRVLGTIPREHRTRVAHFLEKQNFKKQALAVSTDPDHRFDLALALGELKLAYDLALQSENEEKWKQLAAAATLNSDLTMAGECLGRAKDFGGLLLLSTAAGSRPLLGKAAFFARTYAPSQVPRVLALWKEHTARLAGPNQRNVGESLADPTKYENLFPGWADSLKAESFSRELASLHVPAAKRAPTIGEINLMEMMKQAEASGALSFREDGSAVLHGVSRPKQPVQQQQPQAAPAPAAPAPEIQIPTARRAAAATPPALSPVAAPPPPAAAREPSPAPPPKKAPTPEPEPEDDEDEEPFGDDDDWGESSNGAGGGGGEGPDVVESSVRQPDVLPAPATGTAPDLVPGRAANQPATVCESRIVLVDAQRQRQLQHWAANQPPRWLRTRAAAAAASRMTMTTRRTLPIPTCNWTRMKIDRWSIVPSHSSSRITSAVPLPHLFPRCPASFLLA
ncbi:copb-2 [Pristionchus pacificus]|uniref:Beta'-coat protein n=1 Tax=Pristionchus pacificus TaxID=54126 RepID=A0A2A6BEG8_PRIPA|nr:copb-2 [Pristionchus pacificus]|eukprot:PDM64279.1 copb-2 [Pristionchus pacificus]